MRKIMVIMAIGWSVAMAAYAVTPSPTSPPPDVAANPDQSAQQPIATETSPEDDDIPAIGSGDDLYDSDEADTANDSDSEEDTSAPPSSVES